MVGSLLTWENYKEFQNINMTTKTFRGPDKKCDTTYSNKRDLQLVFIIILL